MKKRVWIINHYAAETFFDLGGRHYNFAKYLKKAEYEPVIFCCNAKHGEPECYFDDNGLWKEHIEERIDVPYVFVKGRTYVGNGKQRVLNMVDFYRNVKKTAKEYAAIHGKPDVIFASSVHPLTLVAGIQLAKAFGIKCVCEVRDLWPESIVVYSERWKRENPLIKLLYLGEKWIYKKADAVVFTMEGAYDYIVEQGWEKEIPRSKVHYINNGVDLELFDYNKEHFQIKDEDLENSDTFKVIYTGSLRKANESVGVFPEVAKRLLERGRGDIVLLVYGKGEREKELRRECEEKGIENLILKGCVDKERIPYVLSCADAVVLNVVTNEVMRFGGSQNKLFEYLASGKPIISGQDDKYSIIRNEKCGVSRQLHSSEDIADAILELKDNIISDQHIRSVGQKYDYTNLTKKLVEVIEGVSNR